LSRTKEQVSKDTPCIGICTLNEQDVCIGCNRHIDEIVQAGNADEIPLESHDIPNIPNIKKG
tara:strand:+ start:5056 stop:5241 length:186 start_codon:yes stop_codon:yes gene_type:complete